MKGRIVPDTSVIIDGRITEILKKKKGKTEVLIPEAVISELENQANRGRETGFDGLNELKSLRQISEESKGRITIKFQGKPPTREDVKYARLGRIDELIRRAAEENDAVLVTSDKIQALVSEAKGLNVSYIGPKVKKIQPQIFKLFDSETMSLHIKENTPIFAKKGKVGHFELIEVGSKIDREKAEEYTREIVESAQVDPKGYLEMERRGVAIIQLGEYRIVITRPPFSDGLEITAVKPLVRTKLSDYKPSKKLLKRLSDGAEGIFVAGAPGHGKSTFAQALAEFYLGKGKVIKTMEHPRDLQVPDVVTQYIELEGSMEQTGDILLLVRPDYTIFDEVRKTKDFQIFADMRLAGVGMIGVTHASKTIDAIQRLVGRVELGVIPHIVDTIIYIRNGEIREVYELNMTVKVPHGMREADLARPVIEVKDFETGTPQYELYSYGEEVVVIPIKAKARRESPEEELSILRTKKLIILRSRIHRDEFVKILVNGKEISSARVNRAGNIKIKRNTELGRILYEALNSGKKIRVS
ncbi:MAG: PINc/VapC family ATPase [Candidatus Altiarchaeota archaeon]|nr:PINc/VapC family ATPase [Candidatus Altiarchaeota archaeon]